MAATVVASTAHDILRNATSYKEDEVVQGDRSQAKTMTCLAVFWQFGALSVYQAQKCCASKALRQGRLVYMHNDATENGACWLWQKASEDCHQTIRKSAALTQLQRSLELPGQLDIVEAIMTQDSSFEFLRKCWLAPSVQQSTRSATALLHALTSLVVLAKPRTADITSHQQHAIAQLGSWVLEQRLKPLYSHLSADDTRRSSHTLALLTAIISLSPEHLALFLQRFDFSLAALPKLAAPPALSKKQSAEDAMVTLTDRWTHAKLAKRPSRAGFISLFLACFDSACDAAAVSALLTTHNLGPLVLDSLSRDPTVAAAEVCMSLVHALQHTGVKVLQD